MSQGLEVKQKTLIKKTRRLPAYGEVLVKKGEIVKPETIVARASVPHPEVHEIKVWEILKTDTAISSFMLKTVGEEVKKDEVIAQVKSLFGLVKIDCRSPIDGIIEHISDSSGSVLMKAMPIIVEVKAHVPGKVVDILPEEGVVIESTVAFAQGFFGIGGETCGNLVIMVDSPNEVLSADMINGKHQGKVLVGGSLVTIGALHKAVEAGVRGVISGGVEQKALVNLLGYEIGIGITGNEEIGLTLILTDGFGKNPLNKKIFQLLKSFAGKQACINGLTQIRLGIIRPEIIIPLEDQ